MKANKYIFAVRDSSLKSKVVIVLCDEKIYCVLRKSDMFDMSLHMGCFFEFVFCKDANEMRDRSMELIKKVDAYEKTPLDFKRIEAANQYKRVAKAFEEAERTIAND